MARYVDIEPVMKNIQQLRGCTCTCSDGIVDDAEMMMDIAPDADVIPIPKGATNGDVIHTMFSNVELQGISKGCIMVSIGSGTCHFSLDWWGAPYKEEENKYDN